MADKTARVALTLDERGYIEGLRRAQRQTADSTKAISGHFSDLGSKLHGHLSGAVSKIGGVAKDFVSSFGIPVVGSLSAAGLEAIHMADQFEGARARLEVAVKNVGGNFKQLEPLIHLVDQRLEGLGFTNADTESSLATLTRASGSTQKALSLMGVAADVARGRNIDLGTATAILAKVTTGHVALLGRLGINTKDATGHTISQTAALMKLAALYRGQAAASADTFQGKMQVLRAKLQDVGAHVGLVLIPILIKLGTWFTDTAVPAISKFVGWVQDNWPKLVQAIKPTLDKIVGYVRGAISTIQTIWDHGGKQIVTILEAIAKQIADLTRGMMEIVMGIVRTFMAIIHGDWGKAWNGIKEVLRGIWDVMKGIVGDSIKVVIGLFKGLPGKIVGAIGDVAGAFFGVGKAIVQGIINGILSLGSAIVHAIVNLIPAPIRNAVSAVIGGSGFAGAGGPAANLPSVFGAQNPLGRRAAGGPVSAMRPYLVGEHGAELFVPNAGGTIVPHGALRGSSSAASTTVVVNIHGPVLGANAQYDAQLAKAITNQLMLHQKKSGTHWQTVS